ncbi:MAG: molybdopterin molybdotransferase MoeA [Verrucomicrobiota bacterium]
MLDLETAVAQVLAALPAPQSERIPLAVAAGRILAEPVVAALDLPPFDNSAMDGYAVRAADAQGAKLEAPARLRLQGRIPAGETFAGELAPGECARVFTGAPLPREADAVVMQEDTRREGDDVLVLDSVKPRENVRYQGEDVHHGTVLAEAGAEISPGLIGLLGAIGVGEVAVGRQPMVGLIATGSELQEPGQPRAPRQIYESNRGMLAALLTRAGARPKAYPLVRDTLEATRLALEQAFAECDIVVTSGGVSVGELDFVKAAFEVLGGQLEFWRVAIRPGKPFVFGRLGSKFLFGLPGNPVSASVTFLLLAYPALRHWQGVTSTALPTYSGVLGETFTNSGDRRHWVRVRRDKGGKVFSAGQQASHVLSALARADGLLELAAGQCLLPGQAVTVLRVW